MTEINQGFITHNLYTNVAISHAYYTLTCDFQSSSYSFRKVAFCPSWDCCPIDLVIPRVYNKEGGRVSYSSIVPCTAVVRVQARLIIFTTCCTFTVYTTWQARCVTMHIRLPTMAP